MQFKRIHPGFQLPLQASDAAGGYDLIMPAAGRIHRRENWASSTHTMVGLGFAAKVPDGHVALILPRSGAGAKFGLELRNTVGVIDADYTGEWMVAAKQKEGNELDWAAGDRLFQFIVVPVAKVTPELVDELPVTSRGEGGFGSTGANKIAEEKTVREPEAKPTGEDKTPVPTPAPTPTAEAKSASAPAPKVDGEAKPATADKPKVDGEAQAK